MTSMAIRTRSVFLGQAELQPGADVTTSVASGVGQACAAAVGATGNVNRLVRIV